jgi:hypothetical protein
MPGRPLVQMPVQVAHAEALVRVVVICGCKLPGTVLVITSQYQFIECPNCRSRYFVDKLVFDVQAEAARPDWDGDLAKTQTQININRLTPAVIPAQTVPHAM